MLATLLLCCLPAAELREELPKLAANLARPDAFNKEAARIRTALYDTNRLVPGTWKAFRDGKLDIKAALTTVTGLPANRPTTKIVPTVRRTLEGDGTIVRMITFPTETGLTVTANLYGPTKPRDGMPGLILVHSHHNPKTEGELQDMGQMWAKAGCYVVALDLLGHGERRQHPFVTEKDYPQEFRRSRQDYYFRHNVAIQLQTVGATLMGWMVADISAAVSVLQSLPGIDPQKIAVLGSVAGGGDPAAVAAAMDDRIKAAVVFNFGGPQPETRYPLPDDAETTFNYVGGGSWETTRNLALSAKLGALPLVIVGSIAPRRLVYSHEFAWDQKRDPVWRRLLEAWTEAKVPGHLKATFGTGQLSGRPPEASHCNNIGPVHRKGIHAAFKEWWGIEVVEPTERKRQTASELWCLGPKETLTPAREAARRLVKDGPADRSALRAAWATALGGTELPKAEPLAWTKNGPALVSGPITLLLPEGKGRFPLTVLFGQGGAKELLTKRAVEVAALVAKGEAVAVVDLGGTADLSPSDRGRASGATSVAASALMIGRPLLGERLRALRLALAGLRDRTEIDPAKIRLWGESTRRANAEPPVVPLDLEQPPHAEPLGAHVALLAALFEEGIVEVRTRGGLVTWLSLLDSPAVYYPYDNVVPGAAIAGDWPSVCAAVGIPVRLESLVDGRNRAVPLDVAKKAYANAKNTTVSD